MNGQQDGESPWAGDAASDLIEQGDGRRPGPSWWPPRISRTALVLSVVALVLGLGLGYLAGHGQARQAITPGASPASGGASAAAVGGPTLEQSSSSCSVQNGSTLQLGIEVTNESAAPLTLGPIRVVLPLGGLRVTSTGAVACNELPAGTEDPTQATADLYLPPGGSGWLTMTAHVLVTCPGSLPVQFVVGYLQHGKLNTVQLPGFPDLSQVPFSGCRS